MKYYNFHSVYDTADGVAHCVISSKVAPASSTLEIQKYFLPKSIQFLSKKYLF